MTGKFESTSKNYDESKLNGLFLTGRRTDRLQPALARPGGADIRDAWLGPVSLVYGSGSTFAARSGLRVTRYEALLHLSTHTARSGRERFLSLVAPTALSQLNPCVRIWAASMVCGVSSATGCARTCGLKRTAAIAGRSSDRSNDPGVLCMTSILQGRHPAHLNAELYRKTPALSARAHQQNFVAG